MRFQLASDLHLEHLRRDFPAERVIAHAHGADAVVLAGDIANGLMPLRAFGPRELHLERAGLPGVH